MDLGVLKGTPFYPHLPRTLHEFVDRHVDLPDDIVYVAPDTIDLRQPVSSKLVPERTSGIPVLPGRLVNPLIPYPPQIRKFFSTGDEDDLGAVHDHHISSIITLRKLMRDVNTHMKLEDVPVSFDINVLKIMAQCKYTTKAEAIHLAAYASAIRHTNHELSIAAMEDIDLEVTATPPPPYLDLLIIMQRLRAMITIKNQKDQSRNLSDEGSSIEANLHVFENGSYVYKTTLMDEPYAFIIYGGHFSMYHARVNKWFVGPMPYLDYVLTVADICSNLLIMMCVDDYSWARPMVNHLVNMATLDVEHNKIVKFMKSFEALMLNLSDYDSRYNINWSPVLDNLGEMLQLSKEISKVETDPGTILALFCGIKAKINPNCLLSKTLMIGQHLTRLQCQEVSSLHKFIFYAEVDAQAGLAKYMRRVHTKRKVDPVAIRNMTRLAKKVFFFSYVKKHGMLPNLLTDDTTKASIEHNFRQNGCRFEKTADLSFWDNVTLFNCLDNTLTDNPLEFSKDKGALRTNVRHGPGDSEKELLQVVKSDSYVLSPLLDHGPFIPAQPKVIRTRADKVSQSHPFPTRLIEKEREQKEEARLFGNATLAAKHGLSVHTMRMKKALSYFPHQMMTPSDSDRKKSLHEMAQELEDPHVYSLLLDIEGHNQSMQYENTAELLEFMGNLFGEHGWSELANYFSAMEVYHYDEYLNDVTISYGQKGGIEGWLNPLWTLHTTLMMMLFKEQGDVDMRSLAVYSDDLNSNFFLQSASEEDLASLFQKIREHCKKFGMIAKTTQTNLSKTRVTMLRQHYCEGVRADATLKRAMAISGVNNKQVFCEELEVAAICSSAASALELSNHTSAVCFLKNYKLSLLLARLPHRLLHNPAPTSMFYRDNLPIGLASLLFHIREDGKVFDSMSSEELLALFKNDAARYLNKNTRLIDLGTSKSVAKELYGLKPTELQFIDSPDRLLHIQVYDPFIQDLLFFVTYLPASAGGLGASMHINDMLSGHSEGYTKAIFYLTEWVKKRSSSKQYFSNFLRNALSVTNDYAAQPRETDIVKSTWPTNKHIEPAARVISGAIARHMRKITKNPTTRLLLDLEEEHENLANELLSIFRNNFHHRIVQFYFENSSKHFADLLIRKIETSSSILNEIKNLDALRYNLSHKVERNLMTASLSTEKHLIEHRLDDDIIQTMILYRQELYPAIRFINVEEPLYDNKLSVTDRQDFIIRVYRGTDTFYKNGLPAKIAPIYGNEVRYKGELLDEERLIGQKEEFLAAKIVTVTRWLLTKGGFTSSDHSELECMDVVKACNLSLSTLVSKDFLDLVKFAPFQSGGEILHRIPNMRFNAKSYLRSDPARTIQEHAELNQGRIIDMGLMDSNVNFDYLRLRLILAHTEKAKSLKTITFLMAYALTNRVTIHDVQFVTPMTTSYSVSHKYTCYEKIVGHTMSEYRLRYTALSYMTEEHMPLGLMPVEDNTFKGNNISKEAIVDRLILTYYRSLNRQHMIISPHIFKPTVWKPLIEKMLIIDPSYKDMSDDDWRTLVTSTLLRQLSVFIDHIDDTYKEAGQIALERQMILNLMHEDDGLSVTDECVAAMRAYRRHINLESNKDLKSSDVHLANIRTSVERSTYVIKLATEIIIRHFLVTTVSHSVMTADIATSVHNFFKILRDIEIVLDANVQIIKLLGLCGYEFFKDECLRRQEEIYDRLSNAATSISSLDIIAPTSNLKTGTSDTLDIAYRPSNYHEVVSYSGFDMSLHALNQFDKLQPLIRYARVMVEVFGNPAIYESITGSASMIPQMALFRRLIDDHVIEPTSTICDLTAGRGDGYIGLSHLGALITSFSRLDEFTSIYRHPAVVTSRQYNVMDCESLDFIDGFDVIWVDISFTGKSQRDIRDLIYTIAKAKQTGVIRLNSVDISQLEPEKCPDLLRTKFKIYYSDSGSDRCYQIYLVMQPNNTVLPQQTRDMQQTIAFRAMALSFSQLHKKENLYHQSSRVIPNGITLDLGNSAELANNIVAIMNDSVAHSSLRLIMDVREFIESEEAIVIDGQYIARRNRALWDKCKNKFTISSGTFYPDDDKDQIEHVNYNRQTALRDHLKRLQDPDVNNYHIQLSDADDKGLELISLEHPLRRIRRIAFRTRQLRQDPLIQWDGTIDSLVSETIRIKEHCMKLHGKYQTDFATVFPLMIESAINNDYRRGLSALYSRWKLRPTERATTQRLISMYKQLSPIFPMIHEICMKNRELDKYMPSVERKNVKEVVQRFQEDVMTENSIYKAYQEEVMKTFTFPDPTSIFEHLSADLLFNMPTAEDPDYTTYRSEHTEINDAIRESEQVDVSSFPISEGLTFTFDLEAMVRAFVANGGTEEEFYAMGQDDTIIPEYEGDW